jgi:phosphoglycolate phosphatase-like HAD superfamily hydrolase
LEAQTADPLPSWNDGAAKQAIIAFVGRVVDKNSPEFVRPDARIAAFDNDGTLWCEQPAYFQAIFALDRIKAMAAEHPQWKTTEPFKSAIAGDLDRLAAQGEKALLEIIAATHASMTVDQFHSIVRDWLRTARHPRFHRPYNQCIYQPMVEALAYLRANGFKTFIVSGGGVDFMRPWVERAYGIPPEQVVGSSGAVKYVVVDGKPKLLKEPKVEFIDDGPGKPVGINRFIGRQPIIAFGNSDGDFEMLEWTTAGSGARLGLIVHHTDAEREYAYDRNSRIGRLDRALDEAPKRGWVLIDMKKDWKSVFPSP